MRALIRLVSLVSASLSLLAPFGCGPADAGVARDELVVEQAISSGTTVQPGSPVARSTLMFFSKETKGQHGCSASLIDSSHALTAAHCGKGAARLTDVVLLFATAYAVDAVTRPVTAVFTRRDWPFDGSGDISVLEFSGGVPSGFVPVALASRLPIAPEMPLIHAGFGQTTSTVNDRGTLHAVPGALKEFLEGPARYVATDDQGSICSGDSGGPDYVRVGGGDRLVQVGVHVSGSCENGSLSVSTDVRANLDWIRSTGARPRLD